MAVSTATRNSNGLEVSNWNQYWKILQCALTSLLPGPAAPWATSTKNVKKPKKGWTFRKSKDSLTHKLLLFHSSIAHTLLSMAITLIWGFFTFLADLAYCEPPHCAVYHEKPFSVFDRSFIKKKLKLDWPNPRTNKIQTLSIFIKLTVCFDQPSARPSRPMARYTTKNRSVPLTDILIAVLSLNPLFHIRFS